MRVSAIIAAAGRGTRFGGDLKQLQPLAGRAILDRSVSAFLTHPAIAEVIVALPKQLVDDPPAYLRADEIPASISARVRLQLVAGGKRRQDSVANAFRAAAPDSDVIVIHDAARPCVSADLIARTIAAAAESGAAIAALQARDTVKQGELMVRQAHHERNRDPLILSSSPFDGAQGDREPVERSKDEREWTVKSTLPRESIFLAQTPQAFRRDVLADALELAARSDLLVTDEASLAERAGHPVRLVAGEATNVKITARDDLAIAEAILRSPEPVASVGEPVARGPARTGRAGTGYDLHRLAAGRPLVVGGVEIPSDRGAVGHSDADVACHAVIDALLGAAGQGDIGRHFPDSDPQWKGASSLDLLSRAGAIVRDGGYEVGNVDVTVILEAPKIRDYVEAMRRAIAGAIGIEPARVSVKGKTNEGVEAIGRGEAIAAHAVALIRAR
jgi:2-C-methyl-D-erythritol 4-phosphate cytidylyltransferase / 2-C-methyl-D-erythritol 2,4-cyclodiphosphate synthase